MFAFLLFAPELEVAFAQHAYPALSGGVDSAVESAMQGVLVSARRDGSPITLTVVTDQSGHFEFPSAKLVAGRHTLRIRAAGYELERPQTVTLTPGKAAIVNVRLRKTRDLAAQLTNTEWLMSMPGRAADKRLLIDCMSCHTLERILRSDYSADEFVAVMNEMVMYPINTIMSRVQTRVAERRINDDLGRQLAEYLATVNLGKRPDWSFPLRTLPRPTGRATRVVITEYDLPRKTIAPHDVRTDAQGMIWYANFVENFLGRLDPATGAHTEYAYPVNKPGFPAGAAMLEADQDGNFWLAPLFQTGLVRFNVRNKRFQIYRLPPEMTTDMTQQSVVMPGQSHVDGKVWTNDVSRQAVLRMDIATGRFELMAPVRNFPKGVNHTRYGIVVNGGNKVLYMDFGNEGIARIDAGAGDATIFSTPTRQSRPRRLVMDGRGRIWFPELGANQVAMFDPQAQTFREWEVQPPHTYPYDVLPDRNGELWIGSMASDRVSRFDPGTGRSVQYLLPRPTNVRRVFVDNSTQPVTFWAGSNHGASIVKLEPLD